MKLWSSKTKIVCETSFKNWYLKLKNKALRLPSNMELRSSKNTFFLRFWSFHIKFAMAKDNNTTKLNVYLSWFPETERVAMAKGQRLTLNSDSTTVDPSLAGCLCNFQIPYRHLQTLQNGQSVVPQAGTSSPNVAAQAKNIQGSSLICSFWVTSSIKSRDRALTTIPAIAKASQRVTVQKNYNKLNTFFSIFRPSPYTSYLAKSCKLFNLQCCFWSTQIGHCTHSPPACHTLYACQQAEGPEQHVLRSASVHHLTATNKSTNFSPRDKTGLQAFRQELQGCQGIGHGHNPQGPRQFANAQDAKKDLFWSEGHEDVHARKT